MRIKSPNPLIHRKNKIRDVLIHLINHFYEDTNYSHNDLWSRKQSENKSFSILVI